MALLPDPIRIDVYLTRENLQQFPLAQGTFNSLSLEVRVIASDGEPINLSGYSVRAGVRRGVDGNLGYYGGSVSPKDNTVAIFPITEWMTSTPGMLFFFVELVEENERTANRGAISLPFKILIERTYASEIIASNDFKFLTDNMAAIDDAVKDAGEALSKVEHVAENELAREQAEKAREEYWKTAKPEIEEATEKATAAASHPPVIDQNNHWLEWDFSTQAYKDTGVLAKGSKGDPFQIGGSYATLAELVAAYPNGNGNISYLVDDDLHIWDGTAWKPVETKVDLSEYQTITDPLLKTTDKTIPGAINELYTGQTALGIKIEQVAETVKTSGLLINSNFSVWQRAETATAPNIANYVCVDRWRVKAVSGTPVISRLTPTSGLKCIGGSAQITYTMDAYDLAIVNGKVCTISYKLNGVIKTLQTTPTSATVVSISLSNGDQLEWVKLELGSQATEYAAPNYIENLNECMRYFQQFEKGGLQGLWYNGSQAYFQANLPVPMRSTPTVSKISQMDAWGAGSAYGTSSYQPTNRLVIGQFTAQDSVESRNGKLARNLTELYLDAEV